MADSPHNSAPHRLIDDVTFGDDVFVHSFVNLYGCCIGAHTRVGPFVEIQRGVSIGSRCKIQSHVFICSGVRIEDGVFVSHGVMFVNDKHPRAVGANGAFQSDDDWELMPTVVEAGASIGTGAVVLGGIRIGRGALVGAGAVVTRDVAADSVVIGSPARVKLGQMPSRAL